jgi:hypothetical protein
MRRVRSLHVALVGTMRILVCSAVGKRFVAILVDCSAAAGLCLVYCVDLWVLMVYFAWRAPVHVVAVIVRTTEQLEA